VFTVSTYVNMFNHYVQHVSIIYSYMVIVEVTKSTYICLSVWHSLLITQGQRYVESSKFCAQDSKCR